MEYERMTIKNTGKYTRVNDEYTLSDCLRRLADLEDKIEAKTLVELPCKVGDTIYYVNIYRPTPKIEEYIVTGVEIFADNVLHKISTEIKCYPVKDGRHCNYDNCTFYDSDIFLTEAEAKKKLEEVINGK